MIKLSTILRTILAVVVVFVISVSAVLAQDNEVFETQSILANDMELNVVSHNLRSHATDWPDDLPEISEYINEQQADVVFLQGVDVGTDRNNGVDVVQWLADETGLEYTFFGELHAPSEGLSGNAILSAYPLNNADNLHFEQPQGGEQRGLAYAMIEIEDGVEMLGMVTLFGPEHGNQDAAADQILDFMSDYANMPTIFGAGLEGEPDSPQHATLKQIFNDTWEEVGVGEGRNWSYDDPHIRNSFMLYRDVEDADLRFSPIEMITLDVGTTGHRPFFANFQVALVAPTSSEVVDSVPEEFRLNQNYPNPFNPTTTISYKLPEAAHVTIDVYNVVGQHMMSLVNTEQSQGIHEVNFDAASLSSGIYIYRMQAGSFVQTQTMTLIK